jgi:hypothetical protein
MAWRIGAAGDISVTSNYEDAVMDSFGSFGVQTQLKVPLQ